MYSFLFSPLLLSQPTPLTSAVHSEDLASLDSPCSPSSLFYKRLPIYSKRRCVSPFFLKKWTALYFGWSEDTFQCRQSTDISPLFFSLNQDLRLRDLFPFSPSCLPPFPSESVFSSDLFVMLPLPPPPRRFPSRVLMESSFPSPFGE